MKEDIFHVQIKPHWEVVSEVHNKTLDIIRERKIAGMDPDAIIMVATELIENAVKYGKSVPNLKNIDFLMSMEQERTIKIAVKNGIRSETDLNNVISRLKIIKETGNPAKLYERRLMELLNNPDCKSAQLGLYRISYEGRFELECQYNDNILTVIAQRTF